jgi:kynureninase
MPRRFSPLPGAEGWQLSNPPILPLAALRASLELFDAAGMAALRRKSERLTGYLEFLLGLLPPGACEVLTPKEPERRGCQLSIKLRGDKRRLQRRLESAGIVCDFREPDVLRAAPVPLYNRFADVLRLYRALDRHARETR